MCPSGIRCHPFTKGSHLPAPLDSRSRRMSGSRRMSEDVGVRLCFWFLHHPGWAISPAYGRTFEPNAPVEGQKRCQEPLFVFHLFCPVRFPWWLNPGTS
jgi:hypothetical protein